MELLITILSIFAIGLFIPSPLSWFTRRKLEKAHRTEVEKLLQEIERVKDTLKSTLSNVAEAHSEHVTNLKQDAATVRATLVEQMGQVQGELRSKAYLFHQAREHLAMLVGYYEGLRAREMTNSPDALLQWKETDNAIKQLQLTLSSTSTSTSSNKKNMLHRNGGTHLS